jgi:hypothetical protein
MIFVVEGIRGSLWEVSREWWEFRRHSMKAMKAKTTKCFSRVVCSLSANSGEFFTDLAVF